MKLIEKIFGQKRVVSPSISLQFSELPVWLGSESEKKFSRLHHHIRQMYGEIDIAFANLSVSKEHLESATSINEAYKQIAKAGISNKGNIVKNVTILIDKTVIPENITISGASEFYTSAKSGLKTLIENTTRSQQYAKALFPEEYRGVMDNLSHLDFLLDELMAPINEVKDKLDAYDRMYGKIEVISETRQQIRGKDNHISILEKKHDSSISELRNLESKLDEVEKSEELSRAHELKIQEKDLKDRLLDIDSKVKMMFTPLSKALSRMEKQDTSSRHKMSPEKIGILKTLRDDPVSIIGTDITQFLDEIRIRTEDGTLGLKQQKMNTTIKQLDKLRYSDILSTLYSKRESCLSELEKVVEKLNRCTVHKERKQIEKQISDCRNKIDSTKNDMDTEKIHHSSLKEKVSDLVAELNSDLKFVFDTNIEIIYPDELES